MVFKGLSDLKTSFNSAHDKNDDNIHEKWNPQQAGKFSSFEEKKSPRKFCPRRLSLSGSSINAFQMVQGSEGSDLNNHKHPVDKDNFNDEGSNGDQKNSKKHVIILHALKLLFIASRWP